jgi:hypothetical protein
LNSLTFAQEEGMDKMWGKQKPEISDGSERGKFFSDGKLCHVHPLGDILQPCQ